MKDGRGHEAASSSGMKTFAVSCWQNVQKYCMGAKLQDSYVDCLKQQKRAMQVALTLSLQYAILSTVHLPDMLC